MRTKIIEHIVSLVLVTVALITAALLLRSAADPEETPVPPAIREYAALPFVEFGSPFHEALLEEALHIYYPDRTGRNREIVETLRRHHSRILSAGLRTAYHDRSRSTVTVPVLIGMYLKFILVYLLVMAFVHYGVQTLGVWRFIARKREGESVSPAGGGVVRRVLLTPAWSAAKTFVLLILFSPAYVIAYSIRTEFNTDSLPFLVVLGVISNGVLILYAHKFYTFLIAESRRGYVETARVKGLDASWHAVSWKAVVRPVKRFPGHVLGHIFRNARFQYLGTIKEQSSFLITGLIIIEMALNIHGHLSYELLRQILYRNIDTVAAILLGIFVLVKITEIAIDVTALRETMKYENR